MSRSQPREPINDPDTPDQPEPKETRRWSDTPTHVHWWEAYKLGYRARAWPKYDKDIDDGRYDLKEKETHE